MTVLKRLSVALALVGALAGAAWAQIYKRPQPQTPTIVSGADLGFRIEARKGTAAVGTLMVKIDGEWVEAESTVGVKRVTE
jgi:hypothetical protein